jgi:hypothetical protein
MQHLCKKLGFSLERESDVVRAIHDKLEAQWDPVR